MRTSYLFFFILYLTIANAQIHFEKGYYIDNSGHRAECLIENLDWNNNPRKFNLKLTEGGEIQERTIDNTKEFGIADVSKYVRADVDIDRSSDRLSTLTKEKKPTFVNERMFLKVLVEGPQSLYTYDESGLNRFFLQNKRWLNQATCL
ncbi:MAG TPA: hypothetical protein VGB50_01495 [Flavobacterium sp.]|jgi:hypothetical protein